MKRVLIALGAASAVVLSAVGVWWPTGSTPQSEGEVLGEAFGAVQGPRFERLLDNWAAAHEATGGDRNVEIALIGAFNPSHLKSPVAQAGVANLNLIDGQVRVALSGVADSGAADGADYDVWLVDQRPVAGGTSGFEPSDAYINAGTLRASGDQLELTTALGPEAFTAFQVDDVVITESGKKPTDKVLFRGSPDVFQALYTATRTPELFAMSDFVSPDAFPSSDRPLIGSNTAFAQDLEELRNFGADQMERRKLVNVNRAVVSNAMVGMGARLFITETFNGNGRTCETCHNFLDNVTLSMTDVQLRADSDALFVSEFMPSLAPRMEGDRMRFMQDNPVAVRASARMGVFEDGLDQQPLQGQLGERRRGQL